ncbi:MAG TPA: TolC family protein [Drouetiella sp.]
MLVVAVCSCQSACFAQQKNDVFPVAELRAEMGRPYSLSFAIETALKNYPTLRRSRAVLNRSSSGVKLAKTAYLPSFDILAQELRTTTNNIAGSIFPQTLNVIPTQTGPANDTSKMSSVFANNYGMNFSWLVHDGGRRHAQVDVARAKQAQDSASVNYTALDVATAAGETYLTAVAARERIKAEVATVERMQAYNLIVHTLVDKGLRPGVDTARADADLSASRISLIDAQREAELAEVDLAEAMGIAGQNVSVDEAPWIRKAQVESNAGAYRPELHPLAILKLDEVKVSQKEVVATQRIYRPRLWLHSGIWSRGSGSRIDAHPVLDGLLPQNANYIAGLSIDFPVLGYFAVKHQTEMMKQEVEANTSAYDLVIQQLIQKNARAKVFLNNAQRIAAETPVMVKSAKENETKALERYRVGLSTILEVAEAQRILQDAVVRDSVAQVNIWRAILAVSYANGDLAPFLKSVTKAEAGK